MIISGDKDLAQLVNKNVTLVDTMTRAGAESLILDEKGLKNLSLSEKIIDYLTLVGDTSDNIPCVEKIGPKTAINLLSEFDSLENLIKNSLLVKGVVGKISETL